MHHLICLEICMFVKCGQQIPLSCDIIMHLSTVVIIIINNCFNCIVLSILYQIDKVQISLMVTLQGKRNVRQN